MSCWRCQSEVLSLHRSSPAAQNRKKVLSEEPLFALNAADMTESEEKVWHIGRFLPSIRCAAHEARCYHTPLSL